MRPRPRKPTFNLPASFAVFGLLIMMTPPAHVYQTLKIRVNVQSTSLLDPQRIFYYFGTANRVRREL
jgi:hypothetical protein